MRKLQNEKQTIALMIGLYCRHHHHAGPLCPECRQLLDYAHARLDHCPHGDGKPTCQRCPIHCYGREQRQRVRQVMRWAGPRMLLYHPIAALRHILG